MSKGQLIVLSGPSGVGKSTIVKYVTEMHPKLRFSVSATTREMRPGEVDGESYYFVTREQFDELLRQDALLEHAEYVGNCYGTPAKPIDEALELGYDILLDIEVQGAMQVRAKRPDAVLVFVAAPSLAELEKRLRGRGDTAEDKIRGRLEQARWEYSMAENYDYLLISETGKAEKSAAELMSVITAAHCRTENNIDILKEEL